jgi:hypothetical protein
MSYETMLKNRRIVEGLWGQRKHRARLRKIRNRLSRRGGLKPFSTLAMIYR